MQGNKNINNIGKPVNDIIPYNEYILDLLSSPLFLLIFCTHKYQIINFLQDDIEMKPPK